MKNKEYFNATKIVNKRNMSQIIPDKYIQLGNYKKNANTKKLVSDLIKKGISNPIIISGVGKHVHSLLHKEMETHFNMWLNGVLPSGHYRKEDMFMDILIPILKTEDYISINKQEFIGNSKVDLFISKIHDNDLHSTIIEYDEKYHNSKKQRIKDRKRDSIIIDILKSDYKFIEIIRVKECNHYESLKYLIPYLTGHTDTLICEGLYSVSDVFSYDYYNQTTPI